MPFKHDPETVEHGLHALVMHGGDGMAAARTLAAEGIKVPWRTLYNWRDRIYRDRYLELSKQYGDQLEAIIAAKTREVAYKAQDVTLEALNKTHEKLKADEFADPSTVARNAGVTGGVALDKLFQITGRPKVIIGHLSNEQLIEQAQKDFPEAIIDAAHEEIQDAQLVADDQSAGSGSSNALVPTPSAGADTT